MKTSFYVFGEAFWVKTVFFKQLYILNFPPSSEKFSIFGLWVESFRQKLSKLVSTCTAEVSEKKWFPKKLLKLFWDLSEKHSEFRPKIFGNVIYTFFYVCGGTNSDRRFLKKNRNYIKVFLLWAKMSRTLGRMFSAGLFAVPSTFPLEKFEGKILSETLLFF